MSSILNSLPGIRMPIRDASSVITSMWDADPGEEHSTFHASQMNLVLHFGAKTPLEEAKHCLEDAIAFSQVYPSRIIVLCPEEDREKKLGIECKVFVQCYLGPGLDQRKTTEVLMLAYSPEESIHLRNQVSIWLQSDLPTCHWFHRVPAERIESQYLNFLKSVHRVVFDSSVEKGSLEGVSWPSPKAVRDIANGRLLGIRQSIGQYLSGITPRDLITGLKSIKIQHSSDLYGESVNLENWLNESCETCSKKSGEGYSASIESNIDNTEDSSLSVVWEYSNEQSFSWRMRGKDVEIHSNFNGSEMTMNYPLAMPSPESALSEAFFF